MARKICPHCGEEIPEELFQDDDDFSIFSGVLEIYFGNGVDVVIPDSVRCVNLNAFDYPATSMVKSITFPSSVEIIQPWENPKRDGFLLELESLRFLGGESQLYRLVKSRRSSFFGDSHVRHGIAVVFTGKNKKLKNIFLGNSETPETPESLYAKVGSDARFIGGEIGERIQKIFEERERQYIEKLEDDYKIKKKENEAKRQAKQEHDSALAAKRICPVCGKKGVLVPGPTIHYRIKNDPEEFYVTETEYICKNCGANPHSIKKRNLTNFSGKIIKLFLPT